MAALVTMSMYSWLEPSPGVKRQNAVTDTDQNAEPDTDQNAVTDTDVRVAAAYSAVCAAAEATRGAAHLLMASQQTPRKKSRARSPASTQKGTLKGNNGSVARCLHSVFDQEHSVKVNSVPRSEADKQDPEGPQHNTAATGMELDTAATSVQSSGITVGKRHYTTRGTAGTFQGKRPPKDPFKLEKFLKAKCAYEKEKMELQRQKPTIRRVTQTQQSYRAFHRAFDRWGSATTKEHFIAAAAEWQKKKAREVAERASLF